MKVLTIETIDGSGYKQDNIVSYREKSNVH